MLNTYGTLIRIVLLAALLAGGWFSIAAGGYGIIVAILGYPFYWSHAGITFGVVILLRMFSPRNVFR